jgi:uncharacterized membrane protein
MRDIMDKVQGVLMICGLIGIISVIPTLIRWFFWVLLQMMYYPLTSLIIITNLLLWQYLYIRYTDKKFNKKIK